MNGYTLKVLCFYLLLCSMGFSNTKGQGNSHAKQFNNFVDPIISGDSLICDENDGSIFTYSVPYQAGNSYFWTVNGVAVANDTNVLNVTLFYGHTQLTVYEHGPLNWWSNTDTFDIYFYHPPEAAFSSDYLTPIYAGDTIHFIDNSYDPNYYNLTKWQWYFGDDTGSNFEYPAHQWNEPGTYDVTLIVSNRHGCTDSLVFSSIEVLEGIVNIPNTFTPNNDGYNDLFEITNSGLDIYSLQIFDRWGVLMFKSDGQSLWWDGTNPSGIQCDEGSYFYIIKATGHTGKAYTKAGMINLFR